MAVSVCRKNNLPLSRKRDSGRLLLSFTFVIRADAHAYPANRASAYVLVGFHMLRAFPRIKNRIARRTGDIDFARDCACGTGIATYCTAAAKAFKYFPFAFERHIGKYRGKPNL